MVPDHVSAHTIERFILLQLWRYLFAEPDTYHGHVKPDVILMRKLDNSSHGPAIGNIDAPGDDPVIKRVETLMLGLLAHQKIQVRHYIGENLVQPGWRFFSC